MGVRSRSKRKRRRRGSAGGADLISGLGGGGRVAADTMGVRSSSKRKRRRRESTGADDLISGLGDDVLVHILELLPDAGDAVRTGALSRRWRGLWTRLSSLRFASSIRPVFSGDKGAQRFASFINSAIAVRAAQTDPAVQHLAISFMTPHELLPPSVVSKAAAQRWIRDAVQHDVKTFTLELLHAGRERYDSKANGCGQYAVMILDDLPRSARMETMRLALGGATVRLPTTPAAFASLTDLTLESMEFAVDSRHLLTRLLSSACCPRLQKLQLREVSFATSRILEDMEMLIEAAELLDLSWEVVIGLEILRLRTPRLRVLRMVDGDLISELTISAPRLEELLFLDASQPYSNIDTDGELPCVRSLRVELTSHAYFGGGHDEKNGVTFSLLHCCTAAACLDLDLYVFEQEKQYVNIIEGRIPQLPQVTSLTVHVFLYDLHSFGIGIADILAQCNNLKYLRICCTFVRMDNDFDSPFLCNHEDNWHSHVVYCLPHLEKVEFMGLAGTECELWFMESMLTSTTQLHKVTIGFDQKSSLKIRIHAFERIAPLQDNGIWTCCREPYLSLEWKLSL